MVRCTCSKFDDDDDDDGDDDDVAGEWSAAHAQNKMVEADERWRPVWGKFFTQIFHLFLDKYLTHFGQMLCFNFLQTVIF